MSRHIQVPHACAEVAPWAAVLETDPNAKPEKISFSRFSTFIWLDDARGYSDDKGMSVVKLRRWQKLIDKFEAAKPGDWISLDDEDYDALRRIVENPQRGFQAGNTQIMLACMPYVDAVLDAVTELPVSAP